MRMDKIKKISSILMLSVLFVTTYLTSIYAINNILQGKEPNIDSIKEELLSDNISDKYNKYYMNTEQVVKANNSVSEFTFEVIEKAEKMVSDELLDENIKKPDLSLNYDYTYVEKELTHSEIELLKNSYKKELISLKKIPVDKLEVVNLFGKDKGDIYIINNPFEDEVVNPDDNEDGDNEEDDSNNPDKPDEPDDDLNKPDGPDDSNNPDNENGQTTPEDEDEDSDNPETGDNEIIIYVMMFIISLTFVYILNRNKRNN